MNKAYLPRSQDREDSILSRLAKKYDLKEEEMYNIWMNQWKSLTKYINANPTKAHKIEITDLFIISTSHRKIRDKITSIEKILAHYLSREDEKRQSLTSFVENTTPLLLFIRQDLQNYLSEYFSDPNDTKKIKSKAYNELQTDIRRVEELVSTFKRVKGENTGSIPD